jgi:hypothetical protein
VDAPIQPDPRLPEQGPFDMSDTITDIHKGRYQGIAFALAEVSRLHGEPQFVVDVMSNTGLLFRQLNV